MIGCKNILKTRKNNKSRLDDKFDLRSTYRDFLFIIINRVFYYYCIAHTARRSFSCCHRHRKLYVSTLLFVCLFSSSFMCYVQCVHSQTWWCVLFIEHFVLFSLLVTLFTGDKTIFMKILLCQMSFTFHLSSFKVLTFILSLSNRCSRLSKRVRSYLEPILFRLNYLLPVRSGV